MALAVIGLLGVGVCAEEAPALANERAAQLVGELRGEVEKLRSLDFERPVPVEVIDDEAAQQHMLRRLHAYQPEEELAHMQRAYELLGLLPADFRLLETLLDVLREQAGGFYDPDTESFYLLDDVPEMLAAVVIVHELTHALEDQHFDLDRRLREAMHDNDLLLARSAIHEGSATLLMTLYMSRKMFSGEIDAAELQTFYESELERAAVLDLLPPVFQRQLIAPYMIGASFLVRGDPLALLGQGFPATDVDRAYREPPVSSEQVLHPEKYWDPAARDEPRPVNLHEAGTKLGRRWRLTASGVLGELTLGVLVGAPTPLRPSDPEAQRGASWTNAAASGWGGDRWELWRRDRSAVLLLSTVWDSAEDAREFADALPAGRSVRFRRAGDRVAIVAGRAGRKTERVLAQMLSAVERPERPTARAD